MKTGIANLPLHWGKAPRWLFSRMEKLAREISIAIIEEYGSQEMLSRLSDPYWFQAFGCVLGYDWHSSGVTTTVCGALKSGLKGLERNLDFYIAGGKGGASRKTPSEIESWADKVGLKKDPRELVYASKMSAKVDSTAIQDGYQLYHHNFFFTGSGDWTVVQQGMNDKNRYARRYHWNSKNINSFVDNPKTKIVDNKRYKKVLNLVTDKSKNSRKTISELVNENPEKQIKEYKKIIEMDLPSREWIEWSDIKPKNLYKVLLSTYEKAPKNFEELLGIRGLGPKSLRALYLISEVAYGTEADWEDPAKYAFAHGGKDGYPFPVDRQTYDKSIQILKHAVNRSKLQRSEKRKAQIRLENF